MMPTTEVLLTIGATAIAWTALMAIGAMKLSQLDNQLIRQEARLNLILKRMDIRVSAAVLR
jgi:hypothetical protein